MRLDVESPDDPRLDDYRDLRDRDVARLRGGFIVEGLEVLGQLARSRWRIRSILVAAPRLSRVAPLLESMDPSVPVLVAPLLAMSEVVGFPIHRGVLAIGERASAPSRDAVLRRLEAGPGVAVGLVGLGNHDNVGGCFRNAAALGARAVVLDDTTADPLYRKAIRVSMGHVLRVPFARLGSGADLVEGLRRRGVACLALTPRSDAPSIEEVARGALAVPDRAVLLVGAEGPGLPLSVLERVDLRLRIPMSRGMDSLNAATAAAVGLFALRQASPGSFSDRSENPLDPGSSGEGENG